MTSKNDEELKSTAVLAEGKIFQTIWRRRAEMTTEVYREVDKRIKILFLVNFMFCGHVGKDSFLHKAVRFWTRRRKELNYLKCTNGMEYQLSLASSSSRVRDQEIYVTQDILQNGLVPFCLSVKFDWYFIAIYYVFCEVM